ncbi:NepR family anti-sigma factor [Pararhizobium sp.]|uniref:NepR family anti-sigma factor n=1 Tax=Pararhizobium sp. TaxID=1977563 RepID=UPI0039C8E40F
MSDIPENHRRAGPARNANGSPKGPNAQIAAKLKALYTAVEEEPIPDIFLDLLEQLDQAEQRGKSRA